MRALVTVIATSVAIASSAAAPAHAITACSASTVIGSYGMDPLTMPSQQSVGSGLFVFDGAGKVTGHEIDSFSDHTLLLTRINGTYNVSIDCRIKIKLYYYLDHTQSLNREGIFEGVIVNNAAKIATILTAVGSGSLNPAPFVLEAVQ